MSGLFQNISSTNFNYPNRELFYIRPEIFQSRLFWSTGKMWLWSFSKWSIGISKLWTFLNQFSSTDIDLVATKKNVRLMKGRQLRKKYILIHRFDILYIESSWKNSHSYIYSPLLILQIDLKMMFRSSIISELIAPKWQQIGQQQIIALI